MTGKDIISSFDMRDPTSTTPDVRTKTLEALQTRLSRLVDNKKPGKRLHGLRIGIPQVIDMRSTM